LVGAELSPGRRTLAQRILHAAEEEMAVTLADVVYRRTELGDYPGPDGDAVRQAASIAGDALGWDERRRLAELASVVGVGAA
jgi:glycerol-3-phosphate dehydrogenase